jgi:hypothetical protein
VNLDKQLVTKIKALIREYGVSDIVWALKEVCFHQYAYHSDHAVTTEGKYKELSLSEANAWYQAYTDLVLSFFMKNDKDLH